MAALGVLAWGRELIVRLFVTTWAAEQSEARLPRYLSFAGQEDLNLCICTKEIRVKGANQEEGKNP